MAVTPPPTLTPPPEDVPVRGDRATFSARVGAFVSWLITSWGQWARITANVADNAADAANSASSASTAAVVAQDAAVNGVLGRLVKSVAGNANVTLTATEARNSVIEFTGALTGNIAVIVPGAVRVFWIFNNTSGAFTLTVKTAAGTGIAVAQGVRVALESDGANVVLAQNPGGVTGVLGLANGGTGRTDGRTFVLGSKSKVLPNIIVARPTGSAALEINIPNVDDTFIRLDIVGYSAGMQGLSTADALWSASVGMYTIAVTGTGTPATSVAMVSGACEGNVPFGTQLRIWIDTNNIHILLGSETAGAWGGTGVTVTATLADGSYGTASTNAKWNDASLWSANNRTDVSSISFLVSTSLRRNLRQFSNIEIGNDNYLSCGTAANRFSTVYAGTGSINTSDARDKTAVATLAQNEIAAATALAGEIGTFKFLSSIAEKGDAARSHVGMTVQRAIEIMESFGLTPDSYGFICHDELPERTEYHDAVYDTEGNEITPASSEVIPAGDRYSFRPDELLLFIARGFDARLKALEAVK